MERNKLVSILDKAIRKYFGDYTVEIKNDEKKYEINLIGENQLIFAHYTYSSSHVASSLYISEIVDDLILFIAGPKETEQRYSITADWFNSLKQLDGKIPQVVWSTDIMFTEIKWLNDL